jgi:hypothetical protein
MARLKNNQVSVLLPEGWEDGTIYSFLGPERSGSRSIISVGSISPNGNAASLEDYARLHSTQVIESYGDAETLLEESRQLASGRTVFEISFRFGTGSNTTYISLAYIIENGNGYTFQVRSDRASRQVSRAAFVQLLESFTPIK